MTLLPQPMLLASKDIVIACDPEAQVKAYFLPDAFAARVNTSVIYDHVKKILILTSDKNLFSQDFNDILSDLDSALDSS